MTLPIPAGTTLLSEAGVPMLVGDDSSAEIVAVEGDLLTVKFEDGEEYTTSRSALGAGREIYQNPGNNVVARYDVRGRQI